MGIIYAFHLILRKINSTTLLDHPEQGIDLTIFNAGVHPHATDGGFLQLGRLDEGQSTHNRGESVVQTYRFAFVECCNHSGQQVNDSASLSIPIQVNAPIPWLRQNGKRLPKAAFSARGRTYQKENFRHKTPKFPKIPV